MSGATTWQKSIRKSTFCIRLLLPKYQICKYLFGCYLKITLNSLNQASVSVYMMCVCVCVYMGWLWMLKWNVSQVKCCSCEKCWGKTNPRSNQTICQAICENSEMALLAVTRGKGKGEKAEELSRVRGIGCHLDAATQMNIYTYNICDSVNNNTNTTCKNKDQKLPTQLQ